MAPADQKTITLPLNEFLDMQDKLANAMNTYRGIAMKILEASSNSLHVTTDALTNLHSYTTSALSNADPAGSATALASYPIIAQLLKNPKEKIKDFDSLHLPHMGTVEKTKKSKNARKPKDPDAPKRPDTAYLRFANLNREKYADRLKKEDPSITRGAIAKKLTADWNGMDEKSQQPYKDSYRKEMSIYNTKKSAYEARTGKTVEEKDIDEDEEQADPVTAPGFKEAAESSDDSDDSSTDDSDEDPTPPPTPKAAKGAAAKKGAKASPAAKKSAKAAETGSKKRKLNKDNEEDEGSKKRGKKAAVDSDAEEDGKASKKKKSLAKGTTPIDPRLEKIDKETKRQKRKGQHGDDY